MNASRDLLVITGKLTMNADELKQQVAVLNSLLMHVECMQVYCRCNEIIDINRHRIIHKPFLIEKLAKERNIKSFVFINNLN